LNEKRKIKNTILRPIIIFQSIKSTKISMMEYGPGYLELRLGMVGQKGEEEKMEETRDKDAQ